MTRHRFIISIKGILCFFLLSVIEVAQGQDDKKNNEDFSSSSSNRNSDFELLKNKICNIEIGLEIVRLVSSKTRSVFAGAIEDIELLREYKSEAMYNGGIIGGMHTSLDELAATLDYEARNVTEGTTTLDLGLGWTDDRPDRRIERYVSKINEPIVGTKSSDLSMVDTLSNVIPWIVDRKSKESYWWITHQNGRSEGQSKQKFASDQLYTAAWVGSFGEAWLYYPPIQSWGHPYTLGDIEGDSADSRDLEFFKPNLPENNPKRLATFSKPYPDVTVPGLSMITAMAPVYYTGNWDGHYYNDTFVSVVGIDIAIESFSALLVELEGTLTENSFALLVDRNFVPVVISQQIVGKIYPNRTGFETSRVTYENIYDPSNENIIQDRRNQTYLVSDTIHQNLTNLTNANWTGLYTTVFQRGPGSRGYIELNITLTGDVESTSFYVMYERWPEVDDFILLALAPIDEVTKAINVGFLYDDEEEHQENEDNFDIQFFEGDIPPTSTAIFANEGSLDVFISLLPAREWIKFLNITMYEKILVKAGDTFELQFDILCKDLPRGTSNTLVTLHVEDANYPDCYYSQVLSFRINVQKKTREQLDVLPATLIALACVGAIVFLTTYICYEQKRKKNDSVWIVKLNELSFGNPPEIAGRGTFGLVLLAEYRGTQVAVKRVIPPNLKESRRSQIMTRRLSDSFDGSHFSTNSAQFKFKTDEVGKSNQLISSGRHGSDSATWTKLKKDFIREMRILSKLRHPCVTTVMGAVINKSEEPMLIMEYMFHGSLYDILHNETIVLESDILVPILRDISQGVRFLHATNPQVIHGDLKAQNILVDSKFRAKVADFGLSQKKSVGCTGTPYWMAPELLRGEATQSAATDVYAFGIILYEMYTRKDPYEGEDHNVVLKLVADPAVNKRPSPIPDSCPSEIRLLMKECQLTDPEARPTFVELDKRLKRVEVDGGSTVSPWGVYRKKNASISLFDIFPSHIAEALRDGRKVESEHKDCVTIFFSDIVGFTDISAKLTPSKVANMLDRLYLKFDELSHKFDVFKVETIGDAYMAVTNLVKDQPNDHAKRIADFSVEVIAAANATPIDLDDPSKGCVNIRVGFHSGPVVADVVGSRNPRYCLFGDTVNTASRMESNSKVNRIHCSNRSAELIRLQHPGMHITPRGFINIKGKGKMITFWIGPDGKGEEVAIPAAAEEMLINGNSSDNTKEEAVSQSNNNPQNDDKIFEKEIDLRNAQVLNDSRAPVEEILFEPMAGDEEKGLFWI